MCLATHLLHALAAASGNEQVAMDMLLSDERANVNAHDNKGRTCLHWAGNYSMTHLAELLLGRADIHIDVLDDNGDTATILAAKMNDASVAMLMLGAGCSVTVVGELGQLLAQRHAVHEMVKKTTQLLSLDTMSATDAEGNTPLLCSVIHHHYCVMFFLLQSCVGLHVHVFGEGDRRPLQCVYDLHRCQGADVPDVIAAGRLMHAGDANSTSTKSITAVGYARDHPSK